MTRGLVQPQLPFPSSAGARLYEQRAQLAAIKWSFSRRSVLEQCPFRYYLEYYAVKAGVSRGDEGTDRLRFLKTIQNRHERIGSIAHTVIAAYFRNAKNGDVWSSSRLVDWAQSIFRRDVAFSEASYQDRLEGSQKYPPARLHEYFYKMENSAELCREAEEKLVVGLRTFAESPVLADLRTSGSKIDSIVEGRVSVAGLPCAAHGTVDLGFRSDSLFTVIDWKLGEPGRSGKDSLQLGTYALGVVSKGWATAETMRAAKAYLATGEIVNFSVEESVLARTRARIVQDAERMAVLHDFGMRGVAEAFTPCRQRRVCALCPFQEVCPAGRAIVHG